MSYCTYKSFVIIRHRARVIQDVAALKLLQNTTKIPSSATLFRQSYMPAGLITHKHADYGWECGQKKHIERCFSQIYH
jgi:hypothetical protein